MSTLSFDTGIKTFDINGDPERVISFSPTDPDFIRRADSAFTKMDSIQKSYGVKIGKLNDSNKILQTIHYADQEIRKVIDGVFGEGAADIVFHNISTYAINSEKLPVWCSFMVAVLAQCDLTVTERESLENPKLEALLAKYKK